MLETREVQMPGEFLDTNESDRLEALHRYRILDTDPEEAFDDLTILASYICDTPIALISLVDEDRQWFKSRVGISTEETSRSVSICAHAIQQSDLFVVPDTLDDDRFRDNVLVTAEPHVRFYAGAPLASREGEALGTLCVIDRRPRNLTQAQRDALSALCRQVEAQLELRRNLMDLREALESIERLGALMPYCSRCELNITIPANLDNVDTVREGVTELLEGKGWSEGRIGEVALALDEALSNAIEHGCKNDPSKEVQCLVSFDENGDIVLVVRDPGPGFKPTAIADPRDPANLLKSRGRGVFLINQLMDSVEFADQGRQVEMRKQRKTE